MNCHPWNITVMSGLGNFNESNYTLVAAAKRTTTRGSFGFTRGLSRGEKSQSEHRFERSRKCNLVAIAFALHSRGAYLEKN